MERIKRSEKSGSSSTIGRKIDFNEKLAKEVELAKDLKPSKKEGHNSDPASSRTFILDQQRIKSDTTAIQVSVEQLKQILPLLPQKTISVLDRGDDANWLWCQCAGLGVNVLCRLKGKRCLYRPAPTLWKERSPSQRWGPLTSRQCLHVWDS